MAGGPLDISVPKSLPGVSAIIFCGYPGQSGGQAIADIIFGTFAPAGRLPYTMYPANFTSQVSMFDMNMRPNATSGNPGHTYKFYLGQPVYPFGSGLTYSTFNVTMSGPARLSRSSVEASLSLEREGGVPFHAQSPLLTVTATVTNTGTVASGYVVLLFSVGVLCAAGSLLCGLLTWCV